MYYFDCTVFSVRVRLFKFVFRGLQPVSDEEVLTLYGGTHLAITKINPYQFLSNSQVSYVTP